MKVGGTLAAILLVSIMGSGYSENIDIIYGDRVTLKCRFAPVPSPQDVTLYWIRTNSGGSDNAAIQGTALDTDYSVEIRPSDGSYDLRISNTTYSRDNAVFKCMMKQAGTGILLHQSKISITVLVKPGAPVISPRTPVATEGMTVNLTCSSQGGSPSPEILWYREGLSQPLESQSVSSGSLTSSLLSILPGKEEDGSSWRCTVWNRAMGQRQRLETATRLHVKYFPRVNVGPYNPLLIEEGDTAAMLCEVDSNPQVTSVKWTLAGRYISTTFRHVIPTVSRQDEGIYTCQADNNLGQVGRAELNVSVLHGPRVTLEKLREVELGDSVEIECKTEANPPPTKYLWTRVGEETFREEGRYLRLSNLSHTDSGEYLCSASNLLTPSHGVPTTREGNSSLSLAVSHKPGRSSVSPGEAVGVEGQSVTLSCSSQPPGHPQPQYKWWRTDNPSEILGNSANLTLHHLLLANTASYSCQAYNSKGRGEAGSGELRIIQEPRVVSHLPHQMTRRAGETGVSLTCQARAKPRPDVHWKFNGVKIEESERFLYSVNTTALSRATNRPVTVISTLHFSGPAREETHQLLPADAGQYSCVFVNAAGQDDSHVQLRVEHKPFILNQTTDIKVAADIGETAVMKCGVKAYPVPQFSWSRDSSLVGSLGRLMFQSDSKISDIESLSSFSITSIKQNNYGEYMCKASNNLGSTVHIIRLVKKSRPDPPSHPQSSEAASNSVSVSWTENFHGGLRNVTFRLQYRPQGTTIIYAKEKLCSVNPCRITGLTQHTTYLVRVKAVNRLGESSWSDYATVTTLIDTDQIPRVTALAYHNTTNTLTFRLQSYPLPLLARIQTRARDGAWQLVKSAPLKKEPYVLLLPRDIPTANIRVAVCLQSDSALCGQYSRLDSTAREREAVPQLSTAQGENWLVAVVVGVLVTLLASLLVLVKCCWCTSARRQQKMTAAEREKQLMMTRPDILHPIDEKMLELAQIEAETRQCAHHRSGLYSNNRTGEDSPQPSQDSLWWVKQQCECQGGMRDAQSLPHLSSPRGAVRPLHPQYYSQVLSLYSWTP